jgi:hypothetical protein
MPNNAVNGTYEMCDSDAMDVPGVYTVNGQTTSYAQPPESEGPIATVPYTPRIPASSNCQTFSSAALFTDFASLAPSQTGASSASATGAGASKGTASGGSASATPTSGSSNGAGAVTMSLFSSILGVAFSVAFLA